MRWIVASLRWSVLASFLHIGVGCGGSSRSGSRGPGAGDASANSPFDTLNAGQLDKVDLLFVIDNSSSMADKQQILAEAVPYLIQRLVSPNCVDEVGVAGTTPADPSADCPPSFSREFKPLTNIHIAVITSSLGSHGAPGANGLQHLCEATEDRNDHAELLGSRPRGVGTGYPDASDAFLNWNPNQGASDLAQLNSQFQAMVRSAGQSGCPQPALFESMYRFLVDPIPPLNIVTAGNPPRATPQGIDQNILAQRQAFLRPNSLVAVVMVSDKNDCSIRDSDQFFYAAVFEGLLPKASTVCGTNPNDQCCYSCGLLPPAGCQPDPSCANGQALSADQDPPSLRCYDQKRRFGIDFLYPIKRYVNALTSPTLCTTSVDLAPDSNCPERPDKSAGVVPNPLFQDLTGIGTTPRDPSLISLAAITGVPWQLISDPAAGPSLRLWSADELVSMNLWSTILGDPHPPVGSPPMLATDPHMQESIDPRPGLPGPNAPPDADPVNGHEWSIAKRDDLQYACIFDRPSSGGSCIDPTCDCFARSPGENNPLCADAAGNYVAVQHKAKAYPGLRELELVHDFGKNGTVASICPRNLTTPDAQDYGYRPAVDAIVDRMRAPLTPKCFPRRLDVAPDGTVPCTVIEATTNASDGICDPARNRSQVDPQLVAPARAHLADIGACDENPNTQSPNCAAFRFCEIEPADDSCLSAVPSAGALGWCYVDPDAGRGDPALVVQCPANEHRKIRFVGDNTPARGSMVLIECHERNTSTPPGGGL